jgi:hypothetical protein
MQLHYRVVCSAPVAISSWTSISTLVENALLWSALLWAEYISYEKPSLVLGRRENRNILDFPFMHLLAQQRRFLVFIVIDL